MKEAITTDINGFYKDVTLVADEVTGVFPIYERVGEWDYTAEGEPVEPPELLVGYQVTIKPQEGLHKLKFDIVTETWGEGLTQTELDAIHAYIPPETSEQKMVRLESENASLVSETTRLAARDSQIQDDQMFIMEALATAGLI